MEKKAKKSKKKKPRLTYGRVMTELRCLKVATKELQSVNKKLKAVEKDASGLLKLMFTHTKKIDGFNKRIDNMEEVLLMIHTNVRRNQFLKAEEIYG